MKHIQHLMLNTGIVIAVLYILYTLGYPILSLNFIYLAVTIYVFSLLPDIDSSSSRITWTFSAAYLLIFLVSITEFPKDPVMSILKMSAIFLITLLHFFMASRKRIHRTFPHTFTFGILASFILWFFTSFWIAVIGFKCFTLHLVADLHVFKALKKDILFWKRILRIR